MSGRPTLFKPEYVEQARKLAQLGATDREVAEFFEVAESTLYLWKHSQAAFSEALKTGKDAADDRVEQSLYRKAVGYSFDGEKVFQCDGEVIRTPIVEHVPPSDTAAIFWLKNRRRDQWRDVNRQEHTGADGGAIQLQQAEQDADAFTRRLSGLVTGAGASGASGGADS